MPAPDDRSADGRAGPDRPPRTSEPLRCREPAIATVQVDDDNVRVTRWDFPPGAETGWHRHGMAYVVVPVNDGEMLLELPGGQTATARITAGVAYARAAFSFVETELKHLIG
jgi:hypothetical protein